MFMSALWDTIFDMKERYENAEVFLVDNHIPALRFGTAPNPVVFAAGFGADEWQSCVLLLTFFEKLMEDIRRAKPMAGIAVRKAFKKRSVIIVPCVCPPKMHYEGEPIHMKDLSAFAKYLAYHKAGMLLCVSGTGGTIFTPHTNEAPRFEHATVEKILCACSALTPVSEQDSVAAKLCTWASEQTDTPAYLLSPHTVQMAELPLTYNALEETFVVSSLL